MSHLRNDPHGRPVHGDERPDPGERGFALVAVLFLLVVMAGFAVAMQLGGRTELRIGANHYLATQSYYAAEAGAEKFLTSVKQLMGYGHLTPEKVAEAATLPPDVPGYTFVDFSADLTSDVVPRQIPMGPFAGLTSMDRDLTITSSVEGPDGARATVTMDARAQAIPIFQFAVFYDDDLEISPGPRMDIRGRIHTNAELWIDGGDGFYMHDVVTAAGDLHLEFKSALTSDGLNNHIELNDASWAQLMVDTHDFGGDHDPVTFPSPAQDKAFDDHSKGVWDHNVQTRASGVEPLNLPIPKGIDPRELIEPCTLGEDPTVAASKYACGAGLTIMVRGTTVETFGPGGAPVTLDDGTVEFWINQFYDDREQSSNAGDGNPAVANNTNSNRDVIDIELSKFKLSDYGNGTIYVTASALASGGSYVKVCHDPGLPSEQTLTISVQTLDTHLGHGDVAGECGGGGAGADAAADEQQYVVRIHNGSELKAPLTMVTNLPLYVWGDFNDDDNKWQPASVVSDALTILSNNWSDNDYLENAQPNASGQTTIQAAIFSGHTPSTLGGQGGGQFENFPRFLENFGGGGTVTINGSFVSLWFAQYTNSTWECCNYYSPPVRDWNFDDRFLNPADLPPRTPTAGQVTRMGFARRY